MPFYRWQETTITALRLPNKLNLQFHVIGLWYYPLEPPHWLNPICYRQRWNLNYYFKLLHYIHTKSLLINSLYYAKRSKFNQILTNLISFNSITFSFPNLLIWVALALTSPYESDNSCLFSRLVVFSCFKYRWLVDKGDETLEKNEATDSYSTLSLDKYLYVPSVF